MTLNGVKTVILRYSTKFGSFGDQLRKVVENRQLLSAQNVVKRILLLAIYDLWRYSQRFLRKNLLKRRTDCQEQ